MLNETFYEYTDEKGKPLYRQVRYYKNGEKSFYGEKFENGKWLKGLEGVERVLYKLPQVIEAVKKAGKNLFCRRRKRCRNTNKKRKNCHNNSSAEQIRSGKIPLLTL